MPNPLKRKWQAEWLAEWLREYYTLMPKDELSGAELWQAYRMGIEIGHSPKLDEFERRNGLVTARRIFIGGRDPDPPAKLVQRSP